MSRSKPRVLRIINRFNLGGPTYNACYLTKYLEDEFETLLIGGEKTEDEASSLFIAENLGITPVVIPEMSRSIGFLNEIKAYQRISNIIKSFKPDIVHTHASKAGALGRIAAKSNGVKHIVHTFHGHVFEHYFGNFKTKMVIETERQLAKTCEAIVAISEKQKQDLANRFHICKESKIKVIPLGFELERFKQNRVEKRNEFRTKYGLKENDVAIGIIGRLEPIKNHGLFIKAMSTLRKKGVIFKGIIIGDGSEKDMMMNMIQSEGLSIDGASPDIIFTSWITEIDRALMGLDIVVLTSLNEGTPVSLIEAQASGKPVISSKVGGVENVIIEGKSGLLFENNDLAGCVSHIEKLIKDPEECQRMGTLGEQHVFEKFSVNRLAEDMKKLYFELMRS